MPVQRTLSVLDVELPVRRPVRRKFQENTLHYKITGQNVKLKIFLEVVYRVCSSLYFELLYRIFTFLILRLFLGDRIHFEPRTHDVLGVPGA